MTLKVLKAKYSVCKLSDTSGIELSGEFASLTVTPNEISLVCEEDNVPAECKVEHGWKAFYIEGMLDFSLVGILADIANVLAAQKISIYAMSTYDTDYIFVKEDTLEGAVSALKKQGYTVISE